MLVGDRLGTHLTALTGRRGGDAAGTDPGQNLESGRHTDSSIGWRRHRHGQHPVARQHRHRLAGCRRCPRYRCRRAQRRSGRGSAGSATPRPTATPRPASRRTPGTGRGRPAPRPPTRHASTTVSPRANPATSPGVRSSNSGTGYHVVGSCLPACTRDIRESTGITDSAPAATASTESISGAAVRTASSTASSSVTAEDGQLLQLPENDSRTTPSADVEQPDVTAVGAEVGPHPVQRAATRARSGRADARRAPAAGCRSGRRRRGARPAPDRPPTAMTLTRAAPYRSTTSRTNCSARACAAGVSAAQASISAWIRSPAERQCESSKSAPATAHSPVSDWVGECSLSSDLPSPRYMCTPHGRQGSKLRTVRMMSMPLKFSRSFSSKIGWPCTASS